MAALPRALDAISPSAPVRMPAWALTYAGVNIAADVSSMVTEITYVDHEAHTSDEIEVTLEDRDRRWQGPWIPTQGDQVVLQIGYAGEPAMPCGAFQVDELELHGPPDTFHLKCLAAGITPSLRTPRSAAFESQTLMQIAATVAARHGMTVTGAPDNLNVAFLRVTQNRETDLTFLRRIANRYNYDFSLRGNQLVFYSIVNLESASAVATVKRTDCIKVEFRSKTVQTYKAASVSYQNPATKALITQTAPAAPAVKTGDTLALVQRAETPQSALLQAQAAIHQANMLQVTGKLTLPGTPSLVAGVKITLSGFGAFDQEYMVKSSRHQLRRPDGYTTELDLRIVGAAAGDATEAAE